MTERFFIENKIEKDQKEIILSDVSQIHQITKVLRKKAGDKIVILDNSGFECECEIRQAAKKLMLLKIFKREENKNEPKLNVCLYQSLVKKDKMEFTFEKCTEVGISEFHPVISEHSVKLSFKVDRARKILKEATEQSQRGKIPKLFEVLSFKEAVKGVNENMLNIILHEKEKKNSLFDFVSKSLGDPVSKREAVNIFIGPEGGFSNDEIKLAEEKEFKVLSLGKRVLRAETAAIVSSSFLAINK